MQHTLATVGLRAERFFDFISAVDNPKVVLLRNEEVVRWLFGDLSFLPKLTAGGKVETAARYKTIEDKWGRAALKTRRPDLKLGKQWTGKFGEHVAEEMYMLLGESVTKPARQEHYQPDVETDSAIIEVKTGTYFTGGTAGEKILGCPFKYAEIPELYSKPLKILCLGGAERDCREKYGNLPGEKCIAQKRKFLDFFRENRIEFVGASDILDALSSQSEAH
jgi:hypothetical protein